MLVGTLPSDDIQFDSTTVLEHVIRSDTRRERGLKELGGTLISGIYYI